MTLEEIRGIRHEWETTTHALSGVANVAQEDDILRLAEWAMEHAKPALQYYSLIARQTEEARIVSGAPARESLAAFPKDPNDKP